MSDNQTLNINITENNNNNKDFSLLTDEYIEDNLDSLILEKIQDGIFNKIFVQKLISLSISAKNDNLATIEQEEATYYFRYYYLMIARFILEERIKLYDLETDKNELNDLYNHYISAQERYKKIREKMKWPQLYIVGRFIEAVNPDIRFIAEEDNSITTVILSDIRKSKPIDGELFFIPEVDFYGRIKEIRITASKVKGLMKSKYITKAAFDILTCDTYCIIRAKSWIGERDKTIYFDVNENTRVEIH